MEHPNQMREGVVAGRHGRTSLEYALRVSAAALDRAVNT